VFDPLSHRERLRRVGRPRVCDLLPLLLLHGERDRFPISGRCGNCARRWSSPIYAPPENCCGATPAASRRRWWAPGWPSRCGWRTPGGTCVETVDGPEPGRAPVSSTRRRRDRPGRGQDLVDLLTDQHSRMDGMFPSIMQTRGNRAHTTFATLAELITAREVVEEELEPGEFRRRGDGNRSRNRLPQVSRAHPGADDDGGSAAPRCARHGPDP
jgi:hypothetical protein